jgi:hypothetical protein
MADFESPSQDISTGSAPSNAGVVFGDSGSVNAPSTAPTGTQAFATPGVAALPEPPALPDPAVVAAQQQQRDQANQQAQAVSAYIQQLQQRNSLSEEQLWRYQVSQLSPEQQQQAIQQRQFQTQQASLQQAAQAQASQMQQLEPVFREMTIRDLSQEYAYAGISKEMLGRFSDPESMEAFCKLMGEQRRAATAQQRAPGARAAVAGTGSGAASRTNWMNTPFSQAAAEAFGM